MQMCFYRVCKKLASLVVKTRSNVVVWYIFVGKTGWNRSPEELVYSSSVVHICG